MFKKIAENIKIHDEERGEWIKYVRAIFIISIFDFIKKDDQAKKCEMSEAVYYKIFIQNFD